MSSEVLEWAALHRQELRSDWERARFSEIQSNEGRFREMHVENGSLVWPNGADLCPDVVIWGGLPPVETASDAA